MNLRFLAVAAPLVALVLAIVAAAAWTTWLDLGAEERAHVTAMATSARIGLLALFAIALVAAIILHVSRSYRGSLGAAGRLADGVRLIASANPDHRVEADGAPEMRAVAAAVNALAAARSTLARDVAAQVGVARAEVEGERTRLAALMSELAQAVVVCNREGRILLYNTAAQRLFASQEGGLGLGRSVLVLLDRNLVAHALEAMERQVARAERDTTQFVTASAEGGLLRVRAAPVASGGERVDGYVLLLEDITATLESDARRVALIQGLSEGVRASLANIRAAIENLIDYPDMPAERRIRFAAIIRDESVKLSERLDNTTAELSEQLRVQWPLEDMRGEDLVTLARRRIEVRVGIPTKVEALDEHAWVKVDSFSVAQALAYLAGRLKMEFDVREVRFRLAHDGRYAQLDLIWRGAPLSPETAFAWETDPFRAGGEDSPLTLKAVVERHGGESWYQRDRPAQSAYFRLILPLASTVGRIGASRAPASRPMFYDFDLFGASADNTAFDARFLGELACTVFDTETTGLAPGAGDEIIAIGAVRILNGRLLPGETFEQLVDPQRPLPPESIAIHGITADLLEGQPTITSVLARFHRFAADTVLVGHNVAFDLRFVQIKETAAGVSFDQPVLDTLLLAQVLHPGETHHGLEAIAARFGVEVVGRHTALGDALVTGEVFLRMIPMLETAGIRTLGDARAAAQATRYAQLSY